MKDKLIRLWMTTHVASFEDDCGEIDCTAMVEEWDRHNDSGGATLNPNHPAWTIASEVACEHECSYEGRK